MKPIKLRTENNYDVDAVSDLTSLRCLDVSLAIQSQKDEADINTIVRNFGVTGQLPANVRMPSYGDFEGVDDYRSALHAIRAAENSFMAMSAVTRAEFNNDPQLFLEFCSDRGNLPRLRELGLAPPAVVPKDDTPKA